MLAVALILPTKAVNDIATALRETADKVVAEMHTEPHGNQALSRSITAERKELDKRVTAFNEWKSHKECNADTAEYRAFLKETGRNAPVVDCN